VKLLSADISTTGTWTEPGGSQWSLYFFRWMPRSVKSVIQSRVHRPEVCLAASGLRQVGGSSMVEIHADRFRIPFRKYTYEAEGRPLYVFFCQWEDGPEQQSGMGASKQEDRLRSVLNGRKCLGQQTLEIIITQCHSLEAAERELRQRLPELLAAETPGQAAAAEADTRS
jgi:hypothetical protein